MKDDKNNMNNSTDYVERLDPTENNPYMDKAKNVNSTSEDLEKDIPNLNQGLAGVTNKKAFLALSAFALLFAVIMFYVFSPNKKTEKVSDKSSEMNESLYIDEPPNQATLVSRQTPLSKKQQEPIPVIEKKVVVEKKDPREELLSLRLADSDSFGDGIADDQLASNKEAAPKKATRIKTTSKLLLEGTYIRCTLTSKIVSSNLGAASCIVAENVYSADGSHLLIPKGSKVLGDVGAISDDRVAVIWKRVITPDLFNVTLSSYGTDNMGGTGHPGYVNTHFFKQFASAVMISLIADGMDRLGEKYKRDKVVENVFGGVTTGPAETKTAETLQQLAEQQLEKYENLGAVVTINQGTLINIYVTEDVDFSKVVQ